MSGTSNVGNRGVYEAGDQRNFKESEEQKAERFHEGKPHSHKANDSSMMTFTSFENCGSPTSLILTIGIPRG
jgi:hypothetical protein